MRRAAIAVGLVAAALIASGPTTGPAAASLPLEPHMMYLVDGSTGQLFGLGLSGQTVPAAPAPEPPVPNIGAVDADIDTGIGYAVQMIEDQAPLLHRVSLTTGRYEAIEAIADNGVAFTQCPALSYRFDQIVVSCIRADDHQSLVYGRVNSVTAEFTQITTLPTAVVGLGTLDDGSLRALGDEGQLYGIDRITGQLTPLGHLLSGVFGLVYGPEGDARALSIGGLAVFNADNSLNYTVPIVVGDGLRVPGALMMLGIPDAPGADPPVGPPGLLPPTGTDPLRAAVLAAALTLAGILAWRARTSRRSRRGHVPAHDSP